MTISSKAKTFDDIQEEYNHLFETSKVRDEDRAYRWFARTIFKKDPKIETLMDLACGGGYFLRECRDESKGKVKLTGIDISTTALELSKKECPEAEYFQGVAEKLPFENEQFDAITCLGSMEHFLDIPGAIGEMIRVTKKDGWVFILVPNQFWYKDLWAVFWTGDKKDRNQTQERFATRLEWQETIESAGLKVVETIKYNGIAKYGWKQWLKDLLVPTNLSYHFLYVCKPK